MSTKYIDKNNVILDGDIEGSFIPSNQMEILRDVILEGPFNMNGGIYAQNIRNKGAGTVIGPVVADKEITLLHPPEGKGPIKFLSGLNATISIAIEETARPIEDTVVSDINKASVFVRGDVISDTVKLENAIIIGNVRGRQAFLVNSIVVGSVITDEEAVLTNSSFVSFASGKVTFRGQNSCWLPYGTSLEPIKFEDIKIDENTSYPAELRYMAICKTKVLGCGLEKGNIACKYYQKRECSHWDVRLSSADVRPHKSNQGTTFYALTIANRALNLSKIKEELKRVENFLTEILLYEHLDEESQQRTRNEWKEQFHPDELAILNLII